jgi:hypothetical protein
MALTDNILAYWKLDNNGSGGVSLVDSTGNGNTLNNNGVALGAGVIAGAAVFDGSNNLTSSFTPISGDFSFSFWVKISLINNLNPIFFSQPGICIICDQNGGIYVFNGGENSDINGVGSLAQDEWNHLCVIKNSGTTSLYINGVFTASTQQGIEIGSFLTIGSWTFSNANLRGSLDEVGIWNRALSPAEVTALYNEGAGLSYPFPTPQPPPLPEAQIISLLGATSQLILVSNNFTQDASGQCMLRRVYSCATSYESSASGVLAIDSAPLDGFLPSGVYSLVLSGLSVDRSAGISTFSADYIGLTTKALKTTFSESTLSYAFEKPGSISFTLNGVTTSTPVVYSYTGQYAAPVVTRTEVYTSANTIPSIPSSATRNVRALSSFRTMLVASGQAAGTPPESFSAVYSTNWVLSDSTSTPYGNRFLVSATYTRMITGVTN